MPSERKAELEVRVSEVPRIALDVAFACPSGISAISGRSGSGKSTLLNVIAGLLRPAAGQIVLGGEVIFDAEKRINVPPHRRRAALVPQSLALFPHRTARENVAFALPRSTPKESAQQWLERLRVAHVADRLPATLSGGEAQRVAIARALASEPRALLLDEPFNALDVPLATAIAEDLENLVEEKHLVALLVTHDPAHITRFAKQVIVLEEGRLTQAS